MEIWVQELLSKDSWKYVNVGEILYHNYDNNKEHAEFE